MSNWMIDQDILDNLNVSGHEVPEDILKWLKDVSLDAKEKGVDYRNKLAGQISEEYEIKQKNEEFENWLGNCATTGNVYQSWREMVVLNQNVPIMLQNLWVNYQKKYEFNPLHTHSGFVSFVIFMSIPYDLQDEEDRYKHANNRTASKFAFYSPDHKHPGGIYTASLNVDKSYVGKMIMFKSTQTHGVNPFYTSDDYRITISGNLVFKVTN